MNEQNHFVRTSETQIERINARGPCLGSYPSIRGLHMGPLVS